MKIALCLCGVVGTDEKYGIGQKVINYKIALKHFQEHLFDINDQVDVYFHTWSTEYVDKLKEAYNPVSYKAEEQPFFSEDPRRHATYCRWLSTKKVLELVKETDVEYDFVLLTRFDIAFLVDFDFNEYDNSIFYAQGPCGPHEHGVRLINDLWFFSGPKNMHTLSEIYDRLDEPAYQRFVPYAGHTLVRKHLIETGLEEKVEYIYGVHCGDKDCYACGTQRYVCKKLDELDELEFQVNNNPDDGSWEGR